MAMANSETYAAAVSNRVDRLFDSVHEHMDTWLKTFLKGHFKSSGNYSGFINAEMQRAAQEGVNELTTALQAQARLLNQRAPDVREWAAIRALLIPPELVVNNTRDRANRAFIGGVVAGASLGSIIPGVGTVVGGLFGMGLGVLQSTRFEMQQSKEIKTRIANTTYATLQRLRANRQQVADAIFACNRV